jgi:hypothetical protein
MKPNRDDFDEWEALIDDGAPQLVLDPDLLASEPLPDPVHDIDLAAGEFFRNTWRRRLANAQGDVGYVARQMRKAGIPLDLALVILLADSAEISEQPPVAAGANDRDWPEETSGQGAIAHAA